MAFSRPVGVFGLKVPPNGIRIDANPGLPAAIQISMAAIDPSEAVVTSGDLPARATLKIVRNIFDVVDDYDSEDDDDDEEEDYDEDEIEAIRRRLGITESDDDEEDEEDDDDDEESDEEMVNGAGPSDPEKTRKKLEEALTKKLEEDEEDEEMADIPNGINGKVNKGKARALLEEGYDIDSEDGWTEFVVCTLDPTQHYQQPINITIGDNEECYFQVSGSHTVHLTGNFVIPAQDIDDYSDEDSEDSEAEDLEARLLAGLGSDLEDDYDDESEEDELDDLDDPRITEVDSEDEEAPQLIKADTGKKNKKRAAEEETDDYAAELLEKIAQQEEEKPKSKKQKNNEGKAVAAAEAKTESKKDAQKSKKESKAEAKKQEAANGKKVQFAEKLEQGPTPSKTSTPVKKVVQGVTVEDRKNGTGAASKKGDRVGMRYIGKLKDGKVFDSNKKGKPFAFKLGSGEVIKGWDIGVAGMSVGGERRIIVPAHLAYGKKAMPGIPANSELTFDLKLISLN